MTLFSGQLCESIGADFQWCEVAMRSYMEENSETSFPLHIGLDYTDTQKQHMTLFLVSQRIAFWLSYFLLVTVVLSP